MWKLKEFSAYDLRRENIFWGRADWSYIYTQKHWKNKIPSLLCILAIWCWRNIRSVLDVFLYEDSQTSWKPLVYISFLGLTKLLATSKNYSLLSEAWVLWRDATGKKMKPKYQKLVELNKKAIRWAGNFPTFA